MLPLRSVIAALAERPGVLGALVLSDDGLVVEASLAAPLDAEAIAALASNAARGLSALSDATGVGSGLQVVADGDAGAWVMQRLPSGATLLVLAATQGDLGALLYDIRRHAPALATLA
jgi:predicted regulator of Ras-like GTPase activity (Roadblock/LC7/MglB family)